MVDFILWINMLRIWNDKPIKVKFPYFNTKTLRTFDKWICWWYSDAAIYRVCNICICILEWKSDRAWCTFQPDGNDGNTWFWMFNAQTEMVFFSSSLYTTTPPTPFSLLAVWVPKCLFCIKLYIACRTTHSRSFPNPFSHIQQNKYQIKLVVYEYIIFTKRKNRRMGSCE